VPLECLVSPQNRDTKWRDMEQTIVSNEYVYTGHFSIATWHPLKTQHGMILKQKISFLKLTSNRSCGIQLVNSTAKKISKRSSWEEVIIKFDLFFKKKTTVEGKLVSNFVSCSSHSIRIYLHPTYTSLTFI
jgi:hypothetical protein